MSKKVCIAMSGGVDSAVSAYLLKEQGYDVFALFMRNWEELDGSCPATQEYNDVIACCQHLDIPYFSVNFTKEYWDDVFEHFLSEMKAGNTPNPDVLCNREIKFKALFNKAKSLGADLLATGHYCQTQDGKLLRGADTSKDQSYFLYAVRSEVLQEVIFPIGHMQKKDVRLLAEKVGLPVSKKKDSTGICFIGERNFREFAQKYIKAEPGSFIDENGSVLGTHVGIPFYTIGQRKGLGIGGPGEAWFVARKDMKSNTITLVQGEDHRALLSQELIASNFTWISGEAGRPTSAKIRYRQEDAECTLEGDRVIFKKAERAVTPGQSVVFYDGETCLGGAIIK